MPRDFIRHCLVIDQTQRLTAAQALAHPWLAAPSPSTTTAQQQAQRPDLLPSLRKNFNAKGTWRRAILGVRAAGALRAGGEARRATMMAEAEGEGVPRAMGEEEKQRVREQAARAKRDAEEEADKVDSAPVFAY
ncbi:Calcium/calmodulin-dependent protein kinase type I [Rhodotorula kratochvilovae]